MTVNWDLSLLHVLFGILFSLDVHIAQPRCSREGLGFTTGHGFLSSLRIGRGEVGGLGEGVGGSEEVGIGLVLF